MLSQTRIDENIDETTVEDKSISYTYYESTKQKVAEYLDHIKYEEDELVLSDGAWPPILLTVSMVKPLFTYLSLKNVTTLEAEGCGLDSDGAVILGQNKTLTSLNLSHNSLSGEDAMALAKIPTLKELNLFSNPLGDEGAIALAKVLETNPTLKYLNIYECGIYDQGAEAFSKNTTLKTLVIGGNHIRDKGAAFFANNKTLEELDLHYNLYITDESIIKLSTQITLKNLCFSATITEIGAEFLKNTFFNLNLYYTKLTEKEQESIYACTEKNRQHFDIYKINIYKQDRRKLLEEKFSQIPVHTIEDYLHLSEDYLAEQIHLSEKSPAEQIRKTFMEKNNPTFFHRHTEKEEKITVLETINLKSTPP